MCHDTDRMVIYSLIENALETDREGSVSSSMAATGEKCHNIQPTVSVHINKSFPEGGESYTVICSFAQLPLSILFSLYFVNTLIPT